MRRRSDFINVIDFLQCTSVHWLLDFTVLTAISTVFVTVSDGRLLNLGTLLYCGVLYYMWTVLLCAMMCYDVQCLYYQIICKPHSSTLQYMMTQPTYNWSRSLQKQSDSFNYISLNYSTQLCTADCTIFHYTTKTSNNKSLTKLKIQDFTALCK